MLLGDESMLDPYIKFPFVSQNPAMMNIQPQYTPDSHYYPLQDSYEDLTGYNYNYDDRQQRPLLSNNPAIARITLFKELTAYANYGNPSRNADILYTGTQGTWTFESPAFMFVPGNQRATIVIRAVLDDHSNVPVNRYSARITINGSIVHNGRVNLEHGSPAGGMFTNWRELTFNVPNLRRSTRVTIQNTSSAGQGDWIGLDWMEIRLSSR